ncbi:putative FmdB family regulatory protein [Comamonas sp. BIGb0124]|uniref:FmdB family zinc ribbon protein n=1 Tax=Comamonas sp. BIGb0124 TaxID=2485130 RepID=UPI000F478823|nr:zinc ribbon domain-containing protein [Comamonas sp. BIGb0124]ROR22937.1 putative FmdB family regulatory protein [Comamonas sp. BIGb0124]
MPTYEYDCPRCGGFDARRSVALRNEAAECPGCQAPSPRVMVSAPHLASVPGSVRRAHEVNETARHAPRHSRDLAEGRYSGYKHPSGCGCCSGGGKRTATVTAPDGAKAFPGKRPWMISH